MTADRCSGGQAELTPKHRSGVSIAPGVRLSEYSRQIRNGATNPRFKRPGHPGGVTTKADDRWPCNPTDSPDLAQRKQGEGRRPHQRCELVHEVRLAIQEPASQKYSPAN